MIDHMGAFADEAAARADPAWGAYYVPDGAGGGAWRGDVCVPGVSVWEPANDTIVNGALTHQPYDSQWRLIVSLPAQSAALSASAELVADRAAAAAGHPFLLQANLTVTQLAALTFQPQFSGMEVYPFGSAALI